MLHSHRQKFYIPLGLAVLTVLCLPSARVQAQGPARPLWPTWVYTPWTKTCNQTADGAKQVCSTTKVASDDQGHTVFSAAFIEVEGEQAKTLRITVPMLDLLRNEGPQVSVDYQASLQMPPPGCPPSPETSCVAQSVATADLIGKLKQGQALIIQATSQQGARMTFSSYPLPLAGFAEANESPATSGAPTAPARH